MLKEIFNLFCPPSLHPSVLAKNKLRRVAGGRVLAGPFEGMKCATRSVGSEYEPKLLGTYEIELQPLTRQLCLCEFPLIVNVGAGEGYYAVGMALRCPTTNVVAFESDLDGQALIRQTAQLNGVETRVHVKGVCGPDDLSEVLQRGAPCLVIMDVEGEELSLLQPGLNPGLEACHILVELHDFVHPGLSAEIEARFRSTHRINVIKQRGRYVDDLPIRSPFLDRWMVRFTDEQRPWRMEWFYMQPFLRSTVES